MDDKIHNPSSYAEQLLKDAPEKPGDQKPPEVELLPEDTWLPS